MSLYSKAAINIGNILINTENMKVILRESEDVNKLMELFDTSRTTVLKALDGKSDSDLSMRIRNMAEKMGCRERGEEKVKVL